MADKYTIEFARKIFKERGYTLLENNYKNCKTKMEYHCSYCDSKNFMSLDNMKRGKGCPNCSSLRKKDKEISKVVEERGFNLLKIKRTKYEGYHNLNCITIIIKCSKGHESEVRWLTFKNNKDYKCRICRGMSRSHKELKTDEQIFKEVNKYILENKLNYEVKGVRRFRYKNGTGNRVFFKLTIECPIHGEYEVEKSNFLNGSRCNKCQCEKQAYTLEEVKKLVKDFYFGKYEFISNEYKNMKTKYKFKHSDCKTIFKSTLDNFIRGDVACPICSKSISKGEQYFSYFLLDNNIKFEPQKTFDDCRNVKVLPFDFAIYNKEDSLEFLVEIDGYQHKTMDSYLHKTEKDYDNMKKRDKIKTNYCKNNNINLFRIDYKKINDIIDWINQNSDILEEVMRFDD